MLKQKFNFAHNALKQNKICQYEFAFKYKGRHFNADHVPTDLMFIVNIGTYIIRLEKNISLDNIRSKITMHICEISVLICGAFLNRWKRYLNF